MVVTKVTCPECHATLKPAAPIPVGKKIRCPKCAHIFPVTGDGAPTAPAPTRSEPVAPAVAPVAAGEEAEAEAEESLPDPGPRRRARGKNAHLGLILGCAGAGLFLILACAGAGVVVYFFVLNSPQRLILGKWEKVDEPGTTLEFKSDKVIAEGGPFKLRLHGDYRWVDKETLEIGYQTQEVGGQLQPVANTAKIGFKAEVTKDELVTTLSVPTITLNQGRGSVSSKTITNRYRRVQ